jgi:hypothetical protein
MAGLFRNGLLFGDGTFQPLPDTVPARGTVLLRCGIGICQLLVKRVESVLDSGNKARLSLDLRIGNILTITFNQLKTGMIMEWVAIMEMLEGVFRRPQRLRIAVAHPCVFISMPPVQASPLALRLLVLFHTKIRLGVTLCRSGSESTVNVFSSTKTPWCLSLKTNSAPLTAKKIRQ